MAEELKIEVTKEDHEKYLKKLQDKAEMDLVLAIKHLLALEDHLREFSAEDDGEELWKSRTTMSIERIRTLVMDILPEEDKRYHCMAKHIIGATGALEEVSKLYHDANKLGDMWDMSLTVDTVAKKARDFQDDILGKLFGHEIENCKRCK